jgi:hypothetical protein
MAPTLRCSLSLLAVLGLAGCTSLSANGQLVAFQQTLTDGFTP